MSDTPDRVQKIVVEHLGVEADKVTQEASFIDDLGADSLDIVELVMAFEEEFGVDSLAYVVGGLLLDPDALLSFDPLIVAGLTPRILRGRQAQPICGLGLLHI